MSAVVARGCAQIGCGVAIGCGQVSAVGSRASPVPKAVVLFNNWEGKASARLDESLADKGLSCILLIRARQKARGWVAQTHS